MQIQIFITIRLLTILSRTLLYIPTVEHLYCKYGIRIQKVKIMEFK